MKRKFISFSFLTLSTRAYFKEGLIQNHPDNKATSYSAGVLLLGKQ